MFCLPGIYLALTGLGAGGGRTSSHETAALTNSSVETTLITKDEIDQICRLLYGIHTIAGWCAGPVLNCLRPKWTVYVLLPPRPYFHVHHLLIRYRRILGGIGYPLYVGSLWYYDRVGGQAFPLTAGSILGICAALLWTSSGFIQFAYPEEKDKAMVKGLYQNFTMAFLTVG